MFVAKPSHRAIWVAAIAGVAISLLAWIGWNDPTINFLTPDKRAEWIVFPAAVDSHAHWFASVDVTFRREFTLPNLPRTAPLRVRAMRRAEVKINGVSIPFQPRSNWKEMMSIDVAEQLRPGTNVIEARVFNHNGPPALWLTLTADQQRLRSDRSWKASFAGSSWCQVALATAAKTPRPGNSIAGGKNTLEAAKDSWLVGLTLVAVALGLACLWHVSLKEFVSARRVPVLLLLFASLWLLLFWNNNRLLPFHRGFDSKEHLSYISYVQQHRSLPSPTEGWEMYQPPLYYLIAATGLSLCHLSVDDQMSVSVLRWFGALLGIAQFVLIFFSLRLLLPIRATLIGLLLAAFLPMHLYLAHYVTNEMLAATLATGTLYLCLRLLKNDTPRMSQFAGLGLVLGGAMLAKVTGLLLLPIVIAAIAGKLAYARTPFVIALRNFGVLLMICFAACGWQYVRIWSKFGTPLLGNWDVVSGFTWWQDPGYHTAADYLRFGRSLVHPLFSGFAGFADGIYSTLWGDGLCGGVSSLSIPWNQGPMVVSYLWAAIPTALILIGAAAGFIRFIRKPSSELFLLIGFSGLIVLGLIFMTLKVPSYGQAKAFYALSALMPLCFFGALGWETLTSGRTRLRFVLGTAVLVWALTSFAAYWIVPSVAHLYAAKTFGLQGKIEYASMEAARAVECDPSNAAARGFYALSLSELGQDEEAIKEAERAVELNPIKSGPHLDLAICAKRYDQERAIAEARHAIELGPENSPAYQFLMSCLLASNRYAEAADLGREWLTVAPYDVAAHSALASATAGNGDLVTSATHLGYAMMLRPGDEQVHAQLRQILLALAKEPDGLSRLREIAVGAPDSPRMLDELAWLLATYPDPQGRDGTEAVRLAERACALTNRRIPALLDTLAAAYAEQSDFPRAISAAEEALNGARSFGDNDAVKLSDSILASLRDNLPYREQPE